jgi:hypothetical protein
MTRLSSWGTFFSKLFAVPIGLFLLAMLYVDPPKSSSLAWRLFFPAALVGLVTYGAWYSFRQKFVWADNSALRVSGLFTRCEIPLTNVDRIDESMLLCQVIVRLKNPSAFGRTILFTPIRPFHHLFGPHPVTKQLRELVRHASNVDPV